MVRGPRLPNEIRGVVRVINETARDTMRLGRAVQKTAAYRRAGLEKIPGSARRWRDLLTAEELSYNAGRARIQALSGDHQTQTERFERELVRFGEREGAVETARQRAGLSKRGFQTYRAQFEKQGREGASPFERQGRRWRFRGAQGNRHAFISTAGKEERVTFSGRNLIAIQDYRAAVESRNQAKLDAWANAHPAGIEGDNGATHFPETSLRKRNAALNRMSPRERARFQHDVFATSGRDARHARRAA
jgi:hypothetical protein